MVVSKALVAKIDRPLGVICFQAAKDSNDILNSWATNLEKLLELVEKSCHQIHKETMVHKAALSLKSWFIVASSGTTCLFCDFILQLGWMSTSLSMAGPNWLWTGTGIDLHYYPLLSNSYNSRSTLCLSYQIYCYLIPTTSFFKPTDCAS